jgi:peptidoglycan/LPS O-acetylase OafA/YrhL
MAGAWLFARGVAIKGWMVSGALLAAIAVLYASGAPTADAARLGARQSLWLAVATPAAFGALVLTAAGAGARWADNAPARWLGKVSFGVFLFHFMVMLFLANALGVERDFAILLPLGLAGSVAAGYVSWRVIEEPARRRVRQAQLTYAAR